MKQYSSSILCLAITFLFTGCVPTERFWWSPDGSKAAVVSKGMLRIVDAGGETLVDLSSVDSEVTESVDWNPSGRALVAKRLRSFSSWKKAKEVFPKNDVERIEELALQIPAIVQATLTVQGDTDSLDLLLSRLESKEPDYLRNAFFVQIQKDPESIFPLLDKAPKLKERVETNLKEGSQFVLHRFDLIELEDGPPTTHPMLDSATLLTKSLFSPNDSSLAYGRRNGDDAFVDLFVLDGRDGTRQTVAKRVYPAYAWDSENSLVAAVPIAHSGSVLKQIKRYTFSKGEKPKAEALATAVMPFAPRVEVLPDKSILFASQSSQFPASAADTMPGAALYRCLPDSQRLVRIPTSEGALPMNLGYFTASPDGKHVAVVESDTDAVAVVEVETGEVKIVSKSHQNAKCRTLPAWRNANELSFARLDQKTGKVDWVLWKTGGESTVLNQDWAGDLTDDWIEIEKGKQ